MGKAEAREPVRMRPRTPAAIAVIMLALLALAASCSKEKPEPQSEATTRTEAQTQASLSQVSAGAPNGSDVAAHGALPRMIDLGRGKCIPCKKMEPILKDLTQAYAGKAVIEIINLDDDRDAAAKYNLRVIPTQIFFDSTGLEVWRHEGFLPRDAIVAKLGELGVELADD